MEKKETNSRVGKTYLPWKPKSISRTRQDIRTWNQALNLWNLEEEPQTWPLQRLYDEIRLDGLVSSQLSNRDNQVFSTGFSLKKPNGEVNEEQTKLLQKHPLYRFFTNTVLESKWNGYSLIEFSNKMINGKPELTAELIPRYNVVPRTGKFYQDFTDMTKYIFYRDLPEFGTWILEFNSGYEGELNKVVAPTLLTRFTEACWSELCEIYGIPPRVMKTDTQNTSALSRAEKMMKDMGSAAWFIIDETESFEFAKGVATNGDVYKNLLDHLRDKICLLISGGLISQDTQNGSRAKDEVAFEQLWLLVQADMSMLEEAWNSTIIPALVAHGLLKGELTFEFDPADDTEQLWTYVEGLLPHYKIDPAWVKEKFGVEITEQKERNTIEETLALAMSGGSSGFFLKAPAKIGANCGCLHTAKLSLPKEAPKSEKLISQVKDTKGKLKFDPVTFDATAKTLIKGLNKGLKTNKINLDIDFAYGIDDPHLLTSFEMNLFRFSAGKTLAEVQALNEAFRKAKNPTEFNTAAKQIGDVFNDNWLRTEYDTAVLTGESAANYYSLLRDVDSFPYWGYRTVGDNAVRPEHAALDGLILPANDPLWQKIFPPNGWNCRCYVVAKMAHEVAEVDFDAQRERVNEFFGSEEFDRAVSQGFGVNRATTGEVYTANQQYITGKNLSATNKQLNSLGPDDFELNPFSEAIKKGKGEISSYTGTGSDWLQGLDILNDLPTLYDYNERALAIQPARWQQLTSTSNPDKVKLLNELVDVISKPSELWMKGSRAAGKMDEFIYIRYYQEQAMAVTGRMSKDNVLELYNWQTITAKSSEKFRRGLLIKK